MWRCYRPADDAICEGITLRGTGMSVLSKYSSVILYVVRSMSSLISNNSPSSHKSDIPTRNSAWEKFRGNMYLVRNSGAVILELVWKCECCGMGSAILGRIFLADGGLPNWGNLYHYVPKYKDIFILIMYATQKLLLFRDRVVPNIAGILFVLFFIRCFVGFYFLFFVSNSGFGWSVD